MKRKLNFPKQKQEKKYWCWAATASSVNHYYSNRLRITQCDIVCKCLGKWDCCAKNNNCDVPGYLDSALHTCGNLNTFFGKKVSFKRIKNEIDSGRIVCTRIGWQTTDGHFIAIYGYEKKRSGIYLWIGDPLYRTSLMLYQMVKDYYIHQGTWTHSYITNSHVRPAPRFANIEKDLVNKATNFKSQFNKTNRNERMLMASPHEVFVFEIDHLRAGRVKPIKKALRIIDFTESGQEAIYEFSNAGNDARLLQIVPSETFSEIYRLPYNRAITILGNSTNAKLRLLRQSHLKIEAFWVYHKSEPQLDVFIPIVESPIFDTETTYNGPFFIERLVGRMVDYPVNEDELIGG